MTERFQDLTRVRLKPDVQQGREPWPRPGQQLIVVRRMPPLYLCEWDASGKKPSRVFSDDQLEPWPE
jgi:hypothetical protein